MTSIPQQPCQAHTMNHSDSRPAGGIPPRTKKLLARLQDGDESGAAAGHGHSRQDVRAATDIQRVPVCMSRDLTSPREAGQVTIQAPPDHMQQAPSPIGLSSSALKVEFEAAAEPDDAPPRDHAAALAAAVNALAAAVNDTAVSGENIEMSLSDKVGDLDVRNGEVSPKSRPTTNTRSVAAGGGAGSSMLASPESFYSRSSSSDDDTAFASKATTHATTSDKGKGKDGSAVERKNVHRAAARKAYGKDYILWSLTLLQRACAHRSISKMSTEKKKEVMVDALRAQDNAMKRPSPFFEDLRAIADGKAGRKRYRDDAVPEGAVLALRNALLLVDVERDPVKTIRYGHKEYKLSDIFAAIDKEDAEKRRSGEEKGGGSSATGAEGSGVGRASGPEGGGATERGVNTCERKSPHFMIRLIGILVEDDVRPLLIDSRLQTSRGQLDVSAVGSQGEVWSLAAERFRDETHEVRRIIDHPIVASCDPNTIHQPNISANKLYNIWAAAKAKWNTSHTNWKGEYGNNQPWVSFCQGDTDTFLIGEAVQKYPELDQVCSNLLPDGAQREDDGSGAGDGVTGGADQRVVTKRKSERLYNLSRTDKKKARKREREQNMAAIAQKAVKTAVAELTPLFRNVNPEEWKWRQKTEEAESKSAAITLAGNILSAHSDFEKKLEEEEKRGERGNAKRKAFLKKKIAALEQAMDED